MSKQTNTIVVSSLAIGALAWADPLFIPLVTLGPLFSGLVTGAYGVRPRIVAIPWFCAGLLMLVSDQLIYQEDVAFHAGIAVFTALIAAGAAALARRLRRSRSRPDVGGTTAEAEIAS
jgi:hypothetical protein